MHLSGPKGSKKVSYFQLAWLKANLHTLNHYIPIFFTPYI